MDEAGTSSATRGRSAPDLATIVLSTPTGRRSDGGGVRRDATAPARSGYDARSVLVLAIVVAAIASIVGWTMTIGRDPAAPPRAKAAAEPVVTKTDVDPPAAATAAAAGPSAATAAPRTAVAATPPGSDLRVGRVVARRSASGGGLVRVGVANLGADPLDASRDARAMLLMDGQVVGTEPVGALDAAGTGSVDFTIDYCPAGKHALVAVIDSTARVREANELDNAVARELSFGC